MHFSAIFAAIGSTSIFTTALASPIEAREMSAATVVANINIITTLSTNLKDQANTINLLSGPLFLIGQGPFPKIIVGFTEIVSTVTADMQNMMGTNPINVKSDEDNILDAFRDFVKVHQELLNVLIGNAGILSEVPLIGAPVAAVLRSVESVVDAIALGLINLCPDVASSLSDEHVSLDGTIILSINTYSPGLPKID